MWTRAFTGCPARCGSRSEASRRFIASWRASWYRSGRVRRSPAPAGADRASRTACTMAAHSGLRSPWMTPAPSKVVCTDTPRSGPGFPSGSGWARRARSSAQIAARVRRPAPSRAAVMRISSASRRYSPGMALVHLASCRATDLVSTSPSARAASRTWWSRARAWRAWYSAAWAFLAVESPQEPAADGRLPRVGLLEGPQHLGEGSGGHGGRVSVGHEAHDRAQHLHGVVHVRWDHHGAHGGCVTPLGLDRLCVRY